MDEVIYYGTFYLEGMGATLLAMFLLWGMQVYEFDDDYLGFYFLWLIFWPIVVPCVIAYMIGQILREIAYKCGM